MLKIASTIMDSIVDGPGLRYTVFTQGCDHKCPGCHNPDTHDPNGGYFVDVHEMIDEMLSNPLINGLTISGGEPFIQAGEAAKLASMARERGKNVWVYTGFKLEELLDMDDPDVKFLLNSTDVLVDGRYIHSQKSYEAKFRGSKNQRLIDVQDSLREGKVVLFEFENNDLDKFKVPES